MRTILISGASGFIGSHLTRFYLDRGEKVIALVRDAAKLLSLKSSYNNLEIVEIDFDNYENIHLRLPNNHINIFYYLAWEGYGKDTNNYSVQIKNIKPLCGAIKSISNIGCDKIIFASSFSEYMIHENENLTINSGAPSNVYGSVKHAARVISQAVAAQLKIDFLSVAFANTFGPGDYSRRSANLFVQKLLKGENLDLTHGEHLYDWNYIEDAVYGLFLAGEKGAKNQLYYLGSNIRRPLKDIVTELRDLINPNAIINFGYYKEDFHLDYSSIDVYKLYRDTGYRAKWDFPKAVDELVKWVKSNDF